MLRLIVTVHTCYCYSTHLLLLQYTLALVTVHACYFQYIDRLVFIILHFLLWIRKQIFINSPHVIHTSRIIFSTACPKQSMSSLYNVSPCLQHAFTTRKKGHHLDTSRALIFSLTFPAINLVPLTTPPTPFFYLSCSCALQSWNYCCT